MPFAPSKPFPHDKISDKTIEAIIDKNDESDYNTSVDFLTHLLAYHIEVPKVLIMHYVEQSEELLKITEVGFHDTSVCWLLEKFRDRDNPVSDVLINYLLKHVTDNKDDMIRRFKTYGNEIYLHWLFTAIRSTTKPFPKEFIELCKEYPQVMSEFAERNYTYYSQYNEDEYTYNWKADPRMKDLVKETGYVYYEDRKK
jgi:hypothetical protein